MPHMALPALTAYLRAHGVKVIQRDLNLETFSTLLTRAQVSKAVARLRAWHGPHGERPTAYHPPLDRRVIRRAIERGPWLADRVEGAVATIKGAAFFDGPSGTRAFQVIEQCLQLISLPFYPAALDFEGYVSASPVDSSESLLRAVRDPRQNMFLDLYRQGVVADLERDPPAVVGISIPTMEQMLAGMTLAYLIKERGLPCHVTVGGPHITMLREQIARTPRLFELFDSAVVFDGEKALLRLVEALDGKHELSEVPNLIYKDGSRIRVNALHDPPRTSALPTPDFDGLPLDQYLTPLPVLPLMSARGCYHGRCAFCNVGYGGGHRFSALDAEQLAGQMLHLHHRYGVRHIFFADEAIPPRTLSRLADLMEGTLYWGGCVRFERALTRNLLDRMAAGGALMLLLGLESASPSVVKRIGKGTDPTHMSRILRDSAAAGLWNHVFFFFGFPGETLDDAQETVNFLYAHGNSIHSAAFGTFLLERYSPAHLHPQRHGIARIINNPRRDLAIYFDYQVKAGMDEEMAELVASRLLEVLPDKQYPHFYVNDVFRFLYAARLRDEGIAFPPWLS